ncbi:MAG: squalene synthase HpnC [Deltaproteobacteria bacterium]|nr:squalene synthase HpnC [Deltaproteobacteria bacterium]
MPSIDEAFAYCRKVATRHYENFPVASLLIPKRLRPHVCNIYAFARTADDFADEPRYEGQRLDCLRKWRAMLLQCAQGADISHPIFVALRETIREFALPVELLNDLIAAFAMDCEKRRYKNFAEVMHYCRHSANPIGRLVLHLFGYVNETWMTRSDHVCSALQLANFWQDVAIDLTKDRIYLPQDEMSAHGVTEAELMSHRLTDSLRRLMQFQVDRTRALFADGRALCDLVPHSRLRWELRCTWLGGSAILDKIAANGYDVFRRPTLKLWEWPLLVWRGVRWH